jgi:hypothetical protein
VEVCINNYPVEFELEGETNIADIVDSVSSWARERELVFTEVHVDDERYFVDDLPDRGIDGVSIINCIVRSRADVVFTTIDEGMRYCNRVSSFIAGDKEKNEGAGSIEDLAAGIDWIMEVLFAIFALLGISPDSFRIKDRLVGDHVRELAAFRDGLGKAADGGDAIDYIRGGARLFSDLKDMFRFLLLGDEMKKLIIQSIDSPDALIQSLKTLRDDLPGQLENIEKTAIAFQTGKDADGSSGMDRFIDYVYLFTRTCYQSVPVFTVDLGSLSYGGVTLEQKNGKLHDLLNETIIILENNDIISLSDILEYEILPVMGDLDRYLELLIESITAGGGK